MSKILGPDGRQVSSRSLRAQAGGEHFFDAAKRSGFRGYIFFPTLEPSEQMPVQTRAEVNKKANWLYNNLAEVQAVIDGLAVEEVAGGIWPKATTSNPHFNKPVTDDFHEQNKEPKVFHSGAVQNFYTAQVLIRRSVRLFGELFGQLLRPSMMHFVNTWRCANADTKLDQKKWDDGVMYHEQLGRPLKYRFLTSTDRKSFRDESADDVMHFHDDFFEGQRRGMSCLTPVIRKLFSMDDIERAETSGTLLRTRLAYAITRKDDGQGLNLLPGAGEVEEVAAPGGGKLMIQKIIGLDGNDVEVADLPPNQDIKVVESNRGAATIEVLKWFLYSLALSTKYPNEYLFNLSGLGQGTLVRMVLKRVQGLKNYVRQNQLVAQFCTRWYIFWLWSRIKSGAYDEIEGGVPKDWWRHKMLYPADDTVDVAREGRLFDDRVDSGKMSPETYHALSGEDASDVEDECIEAFVRKLEKVEAARNKYPHLADKISFEAIFTKSKTPILVAANTGDLLPPAN